MTLISTGDIFVNLHQNRDYKTNKVVSEDATVSRVVTHRGKDGKDEIRTLSVSVTARGKSWADETVTHYEINWSAIGSVPVYMATAYAELLIKATEVAERLTKAYVA